MPKMGTLAGLNIGRKKIKFGKIKQAKQEDIDEVCDEVSNIVIEACSPPASAMGIAVIQFSGLFVTALA